MRSWVFSRMAGLQSPSRNPSSHATENHRVRTSLQLVRLSSVKYRSISSPGGGSAHPGPHLYHGAVTISSTSVSSTLHYRWWSLIPKERSSANRRSASRSCSNI